MTACNCPKMSGAPVVSPRSAARIRGAAKAMAAAVLDVLRLHDYRSVATRSVRAALERMDREGPGRDG